MDAVVQMIRNAMCCIKDLQLFSNSFLYNAEITKTFLNVPAPFNQTTPLEVAISITQFYAFVSITRSGLSLIFTSGVAKMIRITQLINLRSVGKSHADVLVEESLAKGMAASQRSIFVGVNVLCIGLAFFWLFANSWHVTQTNWIGGLQGLIHALTIMLIALVPLLYFMVIDAIELISKAARIDFLVSILRNCGSVVPTEIMTAEAFENVAHSNWCPFWTNGSFTSFDSQSEEKRLNEEVASIQHTLTRLSKSDDPVYTKQTIQDIADRIEAEVPCIRYQAYRECLYFVINFIAFYGYFLGIVAYYASHEEELQSPYVRTLKFGLSNADADWRGNFAGDIMWTIEPIVILTSPVVMTWCKTKKIAKKTKSD